MRFGIGGAEYEIDLSTKNTNGVPPGARAVHRARPQGGPGAAAPAGRTASSRERSADIRAWAKDQGITVSDRGRISASVAEQYEAATEGS